MFHTTPEKWLKDFIRLSPKSGTVSLMVWGCFSDWTAGSWVTWAFLNGSATKITYLALLKEYLPPVLQQLHTPIENSVFELDNASVHKTKSVIVWFEENNIDLTDHSPLSPDLNPIEQA